MTALKNYIAALPALALLAVFAAHAEGETDLRFTGAVTTTHDSNLFRLSSSEDTQAIIGRTSTADTYRTTSLGINYNRSYSLQRVNLNVRWTNYQYQKFDYLDFTALNYSASWHWSITPHFYGNASATQSETLNRFSDSNDYTQRNTRSNKTRRLDGTYELGANYQVIGALSHFVQSDERLLVGESSYESDGIDIGVRYVLPYGSSLEYVLRKSDGRSSTRNLVFGRSVQDFDQTDNAVKLAWAITPATKAEMTIGHRNRTYGNLPRADFSGPTGNLQFDWTPTSKTALSIGVRRDVQSYLTASTNVRVFNEIFSDATWSVTPKIEAGLRYQRSKEDYEGRGLGISSQRRDTIDRATISLQWAPRRYLGVSTSLSGQRRKSTLPGLDYRATVVSLTANLTY